MFYYNLEILYIYNTYNTYAMPSAPMDDDRVLVSFIKLKKIL